jgi:hypothetical protein
MVESECIEAVAEAIAGRSEEASGADTIPVAEAIAGGSEEAAGATTTPVGETQYGGRRRRKLFFWMHLCHALSAPMLCQQAVNSIGHDFSTPYPHEVVVYGRKRLQAEK